MHRSAWKGDSANFACTEFSEVSRLGAFSESLSDYTRGCLRYLRLHGVLLLLAMLAGKVLRTVHNDHHDRHRAPQRCEQPRIPNRVSPREHRADETARDLDGAPREEG